MEQARQSERFWAYATAFGALWGFVEVTVGSFMMSLRMPFAGTFLAATGIVILAAQRKVFPVRGVTIATGVVAALCKSISPGGIIIQPMVGIIAEATLAEIAFSILGSTYIGAFCAGVAACLWTLVHMLGYMYIVYGRKLIDLYMVILDKAAKALGQETGVGLWAVVAFLSIIATIGALGGVAGHKIGRDAAKHLAAPSRSGGAP